MLTKFKVVLFLIIFSSGCRYSWNNGVKLEPTEQQKTQQKAPIPWWKEASVDDGLKDPWAQKNQTNNSCKKDNK